MKQYKGVYYAYPTSEAAKNGFSHSGCWLLRVNNNVVFRDLCHDAVVVAAQKYTHAAWDVYSMHEGDYK